MSFQDSKFSLCTKHSDSNFINKLNSDWVEEKKVESLKKVFVGFSDKKFIEHSKSLFYSASTW